jgi:hypothetical protein
MPHMTATFESCPTCHQQFRVQFDKDNPAAVDLAREHLGAKVRECDHQTGGAL